MKDNVKYNAAEGHFAEDLLYHFLEWFKRLWIIILLLAVLLSGLLSAYTYVTYVPKYSASATFTVNVDVAQASSQKYNQATASQLAKTFPNILTSGALKKVICRELGVDAINDEIKASVVEDTNLFTITVTSTNPQQAYNVLSSVISNYPQVARFIIGSTQLNLLDTSSISTFPINYPDYTKKAALGAFAGAALGFAIILLLALSTSTVIRSSDISKSFNTLCLAGVPEFTRKKRSKQSEDEHIPNVDDSNVNYKFRESIFTLRNNVIRRCREDKLKSVVVTSTISGEGKSLIAINLAKGIALKGYKTVVVDFDLRIPSLAQYINVTENVNSVTDYIEGNAQLNNCVYSTHSENLFIAVQKTERSDASEIVGSEKAKEFINRLCGIFDFVIIDTPPSGYISDASVIADYADAVVYVIAQDVVSTSSIGESITAFDTLHAKVIGAVLNRIVKGSDSISYGKYGYSRYARKSAKNGYNSSYGEMKKEAERSLGENGVEFEE